MAAVRRAPRRVYGSTISVVGADFEDHLTNALYLNKNPTRWFKFNEASGNLLDYGTANVDHTWNEVVGYSTAGQAGVRTPLDTAIALDGDGSYSNSTTGPLVSSGATTGTVMIIIKFGSVQTNTFPKFIDGDSPNPANPFDRLTFGLWSSNGYPYTQIATTSATGNRIKTWSATGSLLDNTVHFLAYTQAADGAGIKCYLDGSLVTADADQTSGTAPSVDAWTSIFGSPGTMHWVIGGDGRNLSTSEVVATMYHYTYLNAVVLTADEIAALATFV